MSERPLDPNAGERIPVQHFVVEGVHPNAAAGITQEKVQAAADAAFAQLSGGQPTVELTVGQMVKVADAVTTYYRNSGYIVAKAFLPVQEIGSDGTVKVQVLEGRVAGVVVDGARHYDKNVLAKSSSNLVGQPPTRESVESAVLYAQDNPGVRLFGTFKAGSATGDTNFVLQVLDEDRFSFSGVGDNYGSEFTGKYRVHVDGTWNDPIGFGDALSLSALEAFAPQNDSYGSIAYRVPVGPPGMSVAAGASHNAFSVTEATFAALNLKGFINDYDGGIQWRFKRSRFLNAEAGLSFDHKQSDLTGINGTIAFIHDSYNVVTVDASTDRVDTRFKGVDQVTFDVRQGAGGTIESLGSNGSLNTNFTIGEFRYSRLQALTETQTAVVRVRAQYTGEHLASLEQFSPGGPDSVRAYPVGDYLRDEGVFGSLEYRIQAPGFASAGGPFGRTWGDLVQVWVFGDYAYVQDHSGVGQSPSATLSGYGMSLQFGIPGRVQALVQAAKPISSAPASDQGTGVRVFAQLSIKL